MGLDVKEKALLQFIAKVTIPLALILGPLAAYTGVWQHPMWVLGAFTAVVQAIKLIRYLMERISRRPKRVTTYGQWAIVTGASVCVCVCVCIPYNKRASRACSNARLELAHWTVG